MSLDARIVFWPSSRDRLDPLAKLARWITRGLLGGEIPSRRRKLTEIEVRTPGKRLGGAIEVQLEEDRLFETRVRLPNGSLSAHKKALQLKIDELVPIAPNQLTLAAARTSGPSNHAEYVVMAARTSDLGELAKLARRRGASAVYFSSPTVHEAWLEAPAERSARSRSTLVDLGLALAAPFALMISAYTLQVQLENEASRLSVEYRQLQQAYASTARESASAALSQQIVEQGVLTRRPGAILDILARLNAATADAAWWTSIEWRPEAIALSAQSRNASQAIAEFAETVTDWRVELAGTVDVRGAGGLQQFQLQLTPRDQSPP